VQVRRRRFPNTIGAQAIHANNDDMLRARYLCGRLVADDKGDISDQARQKDTALGTRSPKFIHDFDSESLIRECTGQLAAEKKHRFVAGRVRPGQEKLYIQFAVTDLARLLTDFWHLQVKLR
jgi:hypothetical protein